MKHFLFTQSLSRTRVESTFPTKKPPCAQQESQCARRLKERIARKGGLFNYSQSYEIVTPI